MIIGVGCDLVDMTRIKDGLEKKVLSDNEMAEYSQLSERRKLEYIAGRFATKEALVKANPKPSLLSDYEILWDDGIPVCHIDGYQVHISISHEKTMAMAIAILEKA